jgi:phospholipid transport system substrate-binding protein
MKQWWMGLLVLALAALTMPRGVAAQAETKPAPAKEPAQIVTETVDQVIAILKDPQYKDPALKLKMREKVRKTILERVDIKTVSILTLSNYANQFSPKQFEAFTDLFSQLLFTTYIKHLETYTDEKVVILGTEKPSATKAVVRTKTVTDTRDIPVDFSFTKMENGRWMLYDMHIEGVSLVKNYRSQFREILVKRSADQFLEQLRQKVKDNEKVL